MYAYSVHGRFSTGTTQKRQVVALACSNKSLPNFHQLHAQLVFISELMSECESVGIVKSRAGCSSSSFQTSGGMEL
jgi:hypothetical protein